MELFENEVKIGGLVQTSRVFGDDYLSELRRILLQHVKPVTRAYLEWGTGNTTLALLQMKDALPLDHLFSVDDNQVYLDEIVSQLPRWQGFHPICIDLTGPKMNGRDPELNYSTFPLSLNRQFDFILIDGRRRLECAFVATLVSHPDTIVVLHDYRRARYQPVRALYELVEDGTQFRVMKRRRDLYSAGPPAVLSDVEWRV